MAAVDQKDEFQEKFGHTVTYRSPTGADEARPTHGPYLVVALNCERPQAMPLRISVASADRIDLMRGTERVYRRDVIDHERVCRIKLVDSTMSSRHAFLAFDTEGSWLWDCGSKNGTTINGRRIAEPTRLHDGDLVGVGCTFLIYRTAETPETVVGDRSDFTQPLATANPRFAEELARLARAAASAISILLTGPAGSGRRTIANWVHSNSGRSGAFVEIAAKSLIEDAKGLRKAQGGTLFLSGVDQLGPEGLTLLLQCLRGIEEPSKSIRIVASGPSGTEARLAPAALSTLGQHQLEVPGLMQRPEDVGLFVARFLAREDRARQIRFERPAARALLRYGWPSNIGELSSAISYALAFCEGGVVDLSDLPDDVRADEIRAKQRRKLAAHLEEQNGNVSAVARVMGLSRTHVHRLCKKYGLDPEAFRGAGA